MLRTSVRKEFDISMLPVEGPAYLRISKKASVIGLRRARGERDACEEAGGGGGEQII